MTQTRPIPWIRPEDYEQGEHQAEQRHEYVLGQVYAMAGAGERHNRIALNIAVQLRSAARGGPCGVFISDMKIRIREGECFYYPDLAVVCDPSDDHPYRKDKPCLLVEVLSNSTEKTDRREKLLAYRNIPQLRYYLLVDSRHPRIEYHRRDDVGQWQAGVLESGERLNIHCPPGYQAEIRFDEVYEDIIWPASGDGGAQSS